MSSTTLDRIDPIQALTETPWINQITKEQLELLQKTVAKGLNNAETGQFLELARSLGMNPWANEIWAAKGKGKDGGEGKLLLMVGRDGLIGHAERNFDDYLGYDSGCVYENDEFERMEPNPEAASMRGRAGVVHRQAHPKDRGKLLGAWAVAERRSRPPRYFYAALEEYLPVSENQRKYSPWGSAQAAMMEKVPLSFVHRTLCGLGSVYLEEEIARAQFDVEGTAVDETQDQGEALGDAVKQHLPDTLIKPTFRLLAEMNEVAPNSWTASKVELVFKGKDERACKAELEAIGRAVEELRARPVAGGEEIPEAEVVEPTVSGSDEEAADSQAPSAEVLEKVAVLRSREDSLADRYATADGREEEELGIELDQVRQAIRDLGATPAGDVGDGRVDQGSLPL